MCPTKSNPTPIPSSAPANRKPISEFDLPISFTNGTESVNGTLMATVQSVKTLHWRCEIGGDPETWEIES